MAMPDAMFWKRFSAAVLASERDEEKGLHKEAAKRPASLTRSASASARARRFVGPGWGEVMGRG